MKKTDIELGKKLVEDYYKVGNWYKFGTGDDSVYMCKYLKVEKIVHNKRMPERVFLKGRGFATLKGALHLPHTSKDEPIIFCWAEDYIKKYYQISETEVINIYQSASTKAFFNMFDIN